MGELIEDKFFTNPTPEQIEGINAVCAAARAFADTLCEYCEDCEELDWALHYAQQALMWGNSALISAGEE
jgi:hypothetical protein